MENKVPAFKAMKEFRLRRRVKRFKRGDEVTLVANPTYNGWIEHYIGYYISPKSRGRRYKVKWRRPKRIMGIHFDYELAHVIPAPTPAAKSAA